MRLRCLTSRFNRFLSPGISLLLSVSALAAGPASRPAAPLGARLLIGEPGADRARRIVFVCDGSTAAGDESGAVRAALAEAVAGLRPDQSFGLIFCGINASSAYLVAADDAGRRWGQEFLSSARPSGSADLPAAFARALSLRPDAVMVLADARSFDAAALAVRAREAGDPGRARIDVSVIGPDAIAAEDLEALKRLAASAGGAYRAVDRKALRLEAPEAAPAEVDAPPEKGMFVGFQDAGSVIFLCDASGSMLNKMATLKDQLQKAVDSLRPAQTFNVIFLQDQKCVALGQGTPIAATAENKRRAATFLDNVTTTGTTDPGPGLAAAFAQHPVLLYLLTDGDFPDNKAVKDQVARLNRDHKVRINTIAFVNNTDTDTEYLTLLEGIARDNGGSFRKVEEAKLNGE